MKRRNIAIMAMLALTAGQAFAQRCLPQMKGIEVKVGMADGVYNGKKSCKAGYESVNWDKRTMPDGATLQNEGAFIYGGAVALETEIYLSDAIALTASVKERLVWGNSTGHFHTQFGIGMKFIIN